jgi:type I restriction enzyme S subunit
MSQMVQIGSLESNERGAFKIGPFGSSLKKSELVKAGIPVAGIENVLPNRFEKNFRRFISPEKLKELADYEIRAADILVTTMGTIGRAAVAPPDLGRAIIDSHLFRMRLDRNRVYPQYLCYALNSGFVAIQLSRNARGAIMEGLNTTILRECVVPLPSLPEQQRIAGILEQADRLCRTRRYSLELSDTFLPAALLDFFGHPFRNPNGWETQKLEDVCAGEDVVKAGPFGSSLKKESYSNSGIRIYGQEQVIAGDFTVGNYYISKEMFEDFTAYEVRPGDVLISLVGTFGKVVVVPEGIERGIINPRLLKVSPLRDRVAPVFLAALIEHPTTQLELLRMSHGGTMGILNATLLREMRVIVPPLALQQRFAELVEWHERLRAGQREALRQAEHLFQSLLHRAFTTGI